MPLNHRCPKVIQEQSELISNLNLGAVSQEYVERMPSPLNTDHNDTFPRERPRYIYNPKETTKSVTEHFNKRENNDIEESDPASSNFIISNTVPLVLGESTRFLIPSFFFALSNSKSLMTYMRNMSLDSSGGTHTLLKIYCLLTEMKTLEFLRDEQSRIFTQAAYDYILCRLSLIGIRDDNMDLHQLLTQFVEFNTASRAYDSRINSEFPGVLFSLGKKECKKKPSFHYSCMVMRGFTSIPDFF